MRKEEVKKKLMDYLLNARLIEFRYNDIFNLIFEKDNSFEKGQKLLMNLQIEAESFFCDGRLVEESEEDKDILLSNRLVKILYSNCVYITDIVLDDEFLIIYFDGKYVLKIRNYADSDFAWGLVDISHIVEQLHYQDNLMICCEDNYFYN